MTTFIEKPEATRSLSILNLEDDREFAGVLKLHLEHHGHSVKSVSNGSEGLKLIMHEDFDVIICDLMMPQVAGNMFYVAVEKSKPHLTNRFIFVTGYGSEPKVEQFLKSSGQKHLWKPFSPADLLRAIDEVIRSRKA